MDFLTSREERLLLSDAVGTIITDRPSPSGGTVARSGLRDRLAPTQAQDQRVGNAMGYHLA
jgi:hypothetical protein